MSKRIVLYTLIPKGFLCGNLRKFKIFFVMHLSMPCPGGEQGGGGGHVCNGLLTSNGQGFLMMLAEEDCGLDLCNQDDSKRLNSFSKCLIYSVNKYSMAWPSRNS